MARKKVVPEYGTIMKRAFNITEHECRMRMENGFRYMHRLLKSCTINPLR